MYCNVQDHLNKTASIAQAAQLLTLLVCDPSTSGKKEKGKDEVEKMVWTGISLLAEFAET